MKTTLTFATIAAAILFGISAHAADIVPVTYKHTATGQDVFVACYWAKQFPRFAESEKHLLLACLKTTWQNADPAKRNVILTAIRRFLSGDEPVTKAKIQAVRDALNDANVRFALTDDPQAQLAAWGLEAKQTVPLEEPK